MDEKDKLSPYRNFSAEAAVTLAWRKAVEQEPNKEKCCYHKVPINEPCQKCDAGGNGRYGIHLIAGKEN